MILSSPFSYMQSVEKDTKFNGWSFLNVSEIGSRQIMKAFSYSYYVERFSKNDNFISALDKQTPDFINLQSSDQKIRCHRLYELFRRTTSYGLLCRQFLCRLNIYLGSDQQISNDAKTEFYHDLLMQVLCKSNLEITSELLNSLIPFFMKCFISIKSQ